MLYDSGPTCKMENTADNKAASPPTLTPEPDLQLNNDHLIPMIDLNADPEKERELSSSSSSNSDSDSDSDDEFFQIDATELVHTPPATIPADPVAEINLSAKYLGRKCSNDDSDGSGERRSPAVQVMLKSDAGDLNRIPSSIFAQNSPGPMEWSAASNESLFSIHIGNTSFSKDQMFLMGRSGDLGFACGPIEYPPPFPPSMSPAASPLAEGRGRRMMDFGEMEAAAASANAEAMRDVMRAAAEGKETEKPMVGPLGRSISKHSDGSTASFRSFAFPILAGDARIESIKLNSEYRTPPKLRIVAARTSSTAAIPNPAYGQAPAATASLRSRWLPCFSGCTFCC